MIQLISTYSISFSKQTIFSNFKSLMTYCLDISVYSIVRDFMRFLDSSLIGTYT